MLRARLVLAHDRFADAEGLLVKALRGTGPLATEASETLVKLYKLEGRFDEARRLVLHVSNTYHDPAGVLREMEKLGSSNPMGLEAIRSTLEKAAKNAPDDDRIWLGWANLATRTGRLDEAQRHLDECLRKRPDDPAVWKARLDWALAGENASEVKRAIRHLPPDRFSPSEVLNLRAWLAAQAGDTAGERRAHEALWRANPAAFTLSPAWRTWRRSKVVMRKQLSSAVVAPDSIGSNTTTRYTSKSSIRATQPPRPGWLKRLAATSNHSRSGNSSCVLNPVTAQRRSRSQGSHNSKPTGPWALRSTISSTNWTPYRVRPEQQSVLRRLRICPTLPTTPRPPVSVSRFNNGASSLRQMPETMSGGVGLLDFDSDGWLDVYVTQAGPFLPIWWHRTLRATAYIATGGMAHLRTSPSHPVLALRSGL